DLEAANLAFWQGKLDRSGLQAGLPPVVSHLFDLYCSCRADLLILADDGAIHPGPTIYDSFWIRDSSVEGIACALAGDTGLPAAQLRPALPERLQRRLRRPGAGQRARLLRRRARAQRPGVGRERAGAVGVRPVRPDPGTGRRVRREGLRTVRHRRRALDPGQPEPVRAAAVRLERRAPRRQGQATLLGR